MLNRTASENREVFRAPGRDSKTGFFVLLILLATAAMSLSGIGRSLPLESHETYYARAATEMMARNDYVVPHFNGQPRLQKPPLSYWLIIAGYRLFAGGSGSFLNEFLVRLPEALAGIFLVVGCMLLGAKVLRSSAGGLLTGVIALTTRGFITYTHSGRPEMLHACFSTWAIVGFITLFEMSRERTTAAQLQVDAESEETPATGYGAGRFFLIGVLTWLFMCGALLAKGPFLPVFILLGLITGMLIQHDWRNLLRVVRPVTGVVLVLLLFGSWVYLVFQRMDVAEYWEREMFSRMGGSGEWWWQPLTFYYPRKTPLLILPWLVLIPGSVILPWRRPVGGENSALTMERAELQLMFWMIFVPMFILGFSRGGNWYYMLPVLGPVSVLLAGELHRLGDLASRGTAKLREMLIFLTGLHGVLFIILSVLVIYALWVTPRGAEISTAGKTTWSLIALVGVFWGGMAVVKKDRLRPAMFLLVAAVYFAELAAVGSGVAWQVDCRAADRAFAERIRADLPAELKVVGSRCEVARFVHYAGRQIESVRPRDLADRLSAEPDLLVLTRADVAERGLITGEVVMQQETPCEDGVVLLRSVRSMEVIQPDQGKKSD